MKKALLIFVCILLLAACGPSPEEIALQTHSAATATAASWTKTPTPTHTTTTTPTPEPTPTPTHTPIPRPDRWQETLPDGSTRIVKAKVGYEFILPPHWVITITKKAQQDEKQASFIEQDPYAVPLAASISMLSVENLILSAEYDDPSQSIFPKSSKLDCKYIYLPSLEFTPLEKIAAVVEDLLNFDAIDATFKGTQCKRNLNSVYYCGITYDLKPLTGRSGSDIRVFLVIFKVKNGMVGLVFGTTVQAFPAFVDSFEEIINSIKLID